MCIKHKEHYIKLKKKNLNACKGGKIQVTTKRITLGFIVNFSVTGATGWILFSMF